MFANLKIKETAQQAPAPVKVEPKKANAKKMKRLAPKPIGTAASLFLSWSIATGKLEYTNSNRDQANFLHAVNAGMHAGMATAIDFAGKDSGTFWSTSITNLPRCPTDSVVLDEGRFVRMGNGKDFPFCLPKIGSIVATSELQHCFKQTDILQPGAYKGMGVQGKLVGLGAPVGTFGSWQDFLYCAQLHSHDHNLKFYVSSSMQKKYNEIRDQAPWKDILTIADTSVPPPQDKLTHIVYVNSLTSTGVSNFKGWVPFVTDYTSTQYFVGVSGIYALGPVHGSRMVCSEHQRHFMNFGGLAHFWRTRTIEMRESIYFERALQAKNPSGTTVVKLGFGGVFLVPADQAKEHPDIVYEPSKANWEYDCSGHRKHSTKRPYDLEDAQMRRGTSDAPLIFKHCGKEVFRYFTQELKWGGKKGWAWTIRCSHCSGEYYITPTRFFNESLVPPRPVQPEEEEDGDAPDMDENAHPEGRAEPPAPADDVPDMDDGAAPGDVDAPREHNREEGDEDEEEDEDDNEKENEGDEVAAEAVRRNSTSSGSSSSTSSTSRASGHIRAPSTPGVTLQVLPCPPIEDELSVWGQVQIRSTKGKNVPITIYRTELPNGLYEGERVNSLTATTPCTLRMDSNSNFKLQENGRFCHIANKKQRAMFLVADKKMLDFAISGNKGGWTVQIGDRAFIGVQPFQSAGLMQALYDLIRD